MPARITAKLAAVSQFVALLERTVCTLQSASELFAIYLLFACFEIAVWKFCGFGAMAFVGVFCYALLGLRKGKILRTNNTPRRMRNK